MGEAAEHQWGNAVLVAEILHRPGPARHRIDPSDPGCLSKGSCDNLLRQGLPKDATESESRAQVGFVREQPLRLQLPTSLGSPVLQQG